MMFSLKNCVVSSTTTYGLFKVSYRANIPTTKAFSEAHQKYHYNEQGGTGWFYIVSDPVFDKGVSSALLVVEIAHAETTLECDTDEFRCISNVIEAIFGHEITHNMAIAGYELAACEEECKDTIKNTPMVSIEQYPFSHFKMDAICNKNNLRPFLIE